MCQNSTAMCDCREYVSTYARWMYAHCIYIYTHIDTQAITYTSSVYQNTQSFHPFVKYLSLSTCFSPAVRLS